jgi:L-alanine-DL-glutamate epimerase-like enolase superfamily enzyme
MIARITALDTYGVRFPTSRELDGSDAKLTRLAKQAAADGFTQIKLRVGADLADDIRHMRAARAAVGFSAEMYEESIAAYRYPGGIFWAADLERNTAA